MQSAGPASAREGGVSPWFEDLAVGTCKGWGDQVPPRRGGVGPGASAMGSGSSSAKKEEKSGPPPKGAAGRQAGSEPGGDDGNAAARLVTACLACSGGGGWGAVRGR